MLSRSLKVTGALSWTRSVLPCTFRRSLAHVANLEDIPTVSDNAEPIVRTQVVALGAT
jgi:hypothetical protein